MPGQLCKAWGRMLFDPDRLVDLSRKPGNPDPGVVDAPGI